MPDELSLLTLRSLVRRGLGNLDEDDIENDDVDLLLNLSLWNIADKYDFKEKETITTIPIVEGVHEYDLPSALDAIHSISYIDPDTGESVKLIRMTKDTYETLAELGLADDDTHQAKPKNYLRFAQQIKLHPVPNDVMDGVDLRVAMWSTVESLALGEVETLGLPRNWQEMVVQGAVTRGHYYNEDYTLAQQADNFRLNNERSAVLPKDKEERDKSYARLRVIHEFPDQ